MDLVEQLKRDEGVRLEAYPDPLTGSDPWTIGYGHTGDVKKGDKISEHQAEVILLLDIEKHKKDVDEKLPWAHTLDNARYGCLVNMCFNMGIGYAPTKDKKGKGLLGFPNTLKAVQEGRYSDAAQGMLQSLWAKQVKGRAVRLAKQMETGEWQ